MADTNSVLRCYEIVHNYGRRLIIVSGLFITVMLISI